MPNEITEERIDELEQQVENLTGNYLELLKESEAEVGPLREKIIELQAEIERLRQTERVNNRQLLYYEREIDELKQILDSICGVLEVEHYGSAKAAIGALQQQNTKLENALREIGEIIREALKE